MSKNIIKVLPEYVANKIAAGELIERPAAVIRELIDNAIDAGASNIALYIEEGGIKKIRLVDDGHGMSKEDLELSWLPHATSKIREINDLLKISSMGFRGEALSSIATCSKLSISSVKAVDQEANSAWTIELSDGKRVDLRRTALEEGSVIDVADLFYSFPARRNFLKKTAAEARACRQVLLEKAIAFSEVSFRYYVDGTMNLFLPKEEIRLRLARIYKNIGPENLSLLEDNGDNFSLQIYLAPAKIHRRDRKFMHVYCNRRRIEDKGLLHSIRIAYDDVLPGGQFPVCFVFLQVHPSLVDFNIHPAKKEAKFRNLDLIQGLVRKLIRDFCRANDVENLASSADLSPRNYQTPDLDRSKAAKEVDFNRGQSLREPQGSKYKSSKASAPYQNSRASLQNINVHKYSPSFKPPQAPEKLDANFSSAGSYDFRYLGQIMNLFLLVEKDNSLFIIDQHAAHERVIYEQMCRGELQSQSLLIPLKLPLEQELSAERIAMLKQVAILVEERSGDFYIVASPASIKDKIKQIEELILDTAMGREEFEKELFARVSCRSAIMDGEELEDSSAIALIDKVFRLEVFRCPHGRPIWFPLTKADLFKYVGRDISW